MDVYFLPHDVQRLEAYSRNQVEYRLILDLTTDICLLYFQGKMNDVPIDSLQKVIYLGTCRDINQLITFLTHRQF